MSPQIVLVNRAQLRLFADPLPIITNGCLDSVNRIDSRLTGNQEVIRGSKAGFVLTVPVFAGYENLKGSPVKRLPSVFLVDKIDDYLDDSFLLFGAALGNKQGQGHQSIVSQAFAAVRAVEDTVHAEEIDKQGCCDPFVAVAEGMVFNDEIEEVCTLFLNAGIELFTTEGLVDRPQGALESLS